MGTTYGQMRTPIRHIRPPDRRPRRAQSSYENRALVSHIRNITVDVLVYGTTENNKKKKAAPVLTRIIVPADLPPADFLSRMHAQMNVDPETAMLGWKEAQERRGDPYHRLSSEQDVKDAFRDLIKREEQTNGKTTKKPEKPSETAVAVPELHNVQEKLSCMEHPGKNRWCYVMGPMYLLVLLRFHFGRERSTTVKPRMTAQPLENLRLDEPAEKGRTHVSQACTG
ncbi:hypothetical protein R3P38DRAFT_3191428 [Favolaschia claudopus]|uniref:Uncharacterized protein n=1 Tax=Favolaschia claudopus TaxID=2862362 RepID=A0AAW0BMM4_9AGAR